ncbi:hypothetical protein DK846_01520 [Methanospirillum lacunae]|uniref:Uncharacterized protein n=1 Tax=Methanospirillum lacunae TaxID=668570 RepID=A0A2V2N133_9EURY|nr:hypothetical protein DK846_01520 [Methanospirillum lacunae]
MTHLLSPLLQDPGTVSKIIRTGIFPVPGNLVLSLDHPEKLSKIYDPPLADSDQNNQSLSLQDHRSGSS